MTSADLINKKSKYLALKSKVLSVIQNLNASNINLGNTMKYMSTCFLFDGNTADNTTMQKKYDEINSIIDKLTNIVIPRIDSEVSSISEQISILLKQEAEKRNAAKKRAARRRSGDDRDELY